MRVVSSLVAMALLLAGCADGGAPPEEEPFEDLSGKATSTTGLIRGVVFDPSITPVEGVTVRIASVEREATTGAEGTFVIDGLEPGLYFLDVSKPGYGAVQQSASVEAGVEKPDIIKVQIVADPSLAPFIEASTWAGYFTCSTAAFQVCPAVDNIVLCTIGSCDTLKDEFITIVEVQSPPQYLTSELVWDATQVLARQLDFYLEWHEKNGSSWDYVRSVEGASPLQITVDAEEAAGLDFGTSKDMRHRTFPAIAPESLLFIEQRFDVYSHEFYNTQPPEGWRFTSGDPPDGP